MTKRTYRCPNCQSTDISFEGWIRWDDEKQDFEVIEICDKGHVCCNCEHEDYAHRFLQSPGGDEEADKKGEAA